MIISKLIKSPISPEEGLWLCNNPEIPFHLRARLINKYRRSLTWEHRVEVSKTFQRQKRKSATDGSERSAVATETKPVTRQSRKLHPRDSVRNSFSARRANRKHQHQRRVNKNRVNYLPRDGHGVITKKMRGLVT